MHCTRNGKPNPPLVLIVASYLGIQPKKEVNAEQLVPAF